MAAILDNPAVPRSILDTDLYKLTMQQAVLQHFPDVQATYRFTNRNKGALFSRQCTEQFRASVSLFTDLVLTPEERAWLNKTCPYFSKTYLDYLSSFRFKPEQVQVTFVPGPDDGLVGQVEIEISGPWHETILWEVPLMATLSETYFRTVDTDWDYNNQEELAFNKGKALLTGDCAFSEFGTRRRRSFHTQDLVVQALVRASLEVTPGTRGRLSGTSNVHLAHKHGLTPIGTIAHEWFMAIGALRGYEHANDIALQLWEEAFPHHEPILIALTDTFSTTTFFKEFSQNPERANRWTGLRQDSGDPFAFGPRVIEMYKSLEIDHREKLLIYSDSLNVEKSLEIKQQCDKLGFERVSFGIGTFFTNDFHKRSSEFTQKSKALNMVIKLASINGIPCVKLSDDPTKNTGDKTAVEHVKRVFSI